MTSNDSGTPKRRSLRQPGFVLVALALAALGVYFTWRDAGPTGEAGGRAARPATERAVPVVAEPVSSGDLPIHLNGLGTATPRNRVTVRARVDGQLMRLAFQEGQTVAAGDLLAEIDPRPFELQRQQAQGALVRDQALLANARADLERYSTLFRQGSGSKQQLDTQQALIQQYEGAIATDQAEIASAELQLQYCRITAPIGGRVGLRLIDAGNLVRSADSTGLVVITELQPINVLFTLPADDLPRLLARLASGDQLPVEVYDRANVTRLASGALLTLDNQIDSTTGTIRLKAELPNEAGTLFPNQFVNVRLLLDTLRARPLLATAAVQRGTSGTYVYVVDAQRRVHARAVTLGPAEGERVAVDAGLAVGELVVVDGTDKLREGTLVSLGERGAAPGGGTGDGQPGGPGPNGHQKRAAP